jgi:hypothetical protein
VRSLFSGSQKLTGDNHLPFASTENDFAEKANIAAAAYAAEMKGLL